MKELSRAEKIKVAKACIRKGMPISELKGMGIDISKFPPNCLLYTSPSPRD